MVGAAAYWQYTRVVNSGDQVKAATQLSYCLFTIPMITPKSIQTSPLACPPLGTPPPSTHPTQLNTRPHHNTQLWHISPQNWSYSMIVYLQTSHMQCLVSLWRTTSAIPVNNLPSVDPQIFSRSPFSHTFRLILLSPLIKLITGVEMYVSSEANVVCHNIGLAWVQKAKARWQKKTTVSAGFVFIGAYWKQRLRRFLRTRAHPRHLAALGSVLLWWFGPTFPPCCFESVSTTSFSWLSDGNITLVYKCSPNLCQIYGAYRVVKDTTPVDRIQFQESTRTAKRVSYHNLRE